jgi:signal peptidase I
LVLRRALRWTEHLLACIGAGFLIYHFTLELAVMTSESMAPALEGTSYENGDHILVEKVTGRLRAPRRWEIYSYYDDNGILVMKRVVGLPGEKISIKDRTLLINGSPLKLPQEIPVARYYAYGKLEKGQEVDCGPGYFMLGDASVDSLDSRFTGPVTADRFRGRAWCIVSPAGRRGFVR